MKFTVTFKDPDVVQDAIQDAVMEGMAALNLPEDERAPVEELRREKLSNLCRTWFRYGEYVTVEIDTDAKTATVLPAR